MVNPHGYTNNATKNAYALGLSDSGLRTWVAMRLAKDVDTCCSLLRGEAVDPARLDGGEVEFMRMMRLIRLDVRAITAVEDSLRRHRLVELVKEAA